MPQDLADWLPGFDQEITAGGKVAFTLGAGSTAPKVCFGSGVCTLTAPLGSLYLRTDGGANTRLYVNSDAGTTWVAVSSS
jgi:hypothetical protein